jgi:hypothetical protein
MNEQQEYQDMYDAPAETQPAISVNGGLSASIRQARATNADARESAPADGAINTFDTAVEFFNPTGLDRSANRYILFVGDLIADKQARPDFFLGGEYFGHDFPALHVSNYVLHRCRITPLTVQPRPQSADEPLINPEVEKFAGKIRLPEGAQLAGRLQHVKTFPGDQLDALVYGARDGGSKGVVEVKAFQSLDYSQRETQRLLNDVQEKIFPGWSQIMRGAEKLPKTLRGIEMIVREAQQKYSSDSIIRDTCRDFLESARLFRAWGAIYLQKEGTRIRAGVNPQGGYVHSYSPIAELLLAQLEMKRENLLEDRSDDILKAMAATTEMAQALAAGKTGNEEETQAVLKTLAETQAAMAQMMQQNQLLFAQMLANGGRVVPSVPEEIGRAIDAAKTEENKTKNSVKK